MSKLFVADERAAEVTELAIALGLIVAGAIVAITLIGPKVVQFFVSVNSAF